jgi:hypothetical protein
MDQDMALVADKGPYGAVLVGGRTLTPLTVNPIGKASEAWRPLNSLNHGGLGDGEGQNVMYPDGRADWFATPLAGVLKDNIYTRWKVTGTAPTITIDRTLGIAPGPLPGTFVYPTAQALYPTSLTDPSPRANTDSLIYP